MWGHRPCFAVETWNNKYYDFKARLGSIYFLSQLEQLVLVYFNIAHDNNILLFIIVRDSNDLKIYSNETK